MAFIPSSGSVVAFQGNPSVLQVLAGLQSTNASVITVGSPVGNQSVSGTVGASVIGHAPVVIVGGSILTSATANQSVSGAVQVAGNSPSSLLTLTRLDNQIIGSMVGITGQVTIHGVTALGSGQFTDIRADAGTGALLSSIVGLQGASVSGTVGASVIGTVPVTQATTPWTIGSIYGNISGSVAAFQAGTQVTSLVSIVPSSVLVGASIFGQLPAGTAVLGSVAALQGTNPWTVTTNGTSVLTVWGKSPSIVGTYAEDAAHATGEKGIFALGVRNDAQSSVTSADGDYSPITVGLTGAVTSHDAPINKWVSGIADLRLVQGASVVAIAAQGASVFTYVREVQVSNFGPSSVLVKIGGGLGSTLGWTIAPAGGGSNFVTRYKTGENSAVTASINGTASVLVTLAGFTAKE